MQQAKEPISVHYEAEKTVSFYQHIYIIDIAYNKKKRAVDITTEDKIIIQMHNIMTKMLQNRSFEILHFSKMTVERLFILYMEQKIHFREFKGK